MLKQGWLLEDYHLGGPSLFDVFVIGFILLFPIFPRYCFGQGAQIWFVYGSFFLTAVGFTQKPVREYHSKALGWLVVWAMFNIWRNNFKPEFGLDPLMEPLNTFINFCYLNEGFIYILAAALLIVSIVRNAQNYGWYIVAILMIIGAFLVTFVIPTRSNSALMALVISIPIVLYKRKERFIATVILATALALVCWRWEWLAFKFRTRPLTWTYAWNEILQHPFWGNGFDASVNGMTGMIPLKMWGLTYRANDYLEYARSHGITGLALVMAFLWPIFVRVRPGIVAWLGISVAILCMFQRTVFNPIHGGIVTVIVALMVIEGTAKEKLLSPTKVGGGTNDSWTWKALFGRRRNNGSTGIEERSGKYLKISQGEPWSVSD